MAAASAESEESVEPTATITTTLRPGYNYFGWVAADRPVAELFAEVPQLDAAWTWDATASRWLAAFRSGRAPANAIRFARPRGLPSPTRAENRGVLTTLRPGMGLVLHIDSSTPVEWNRGLTPGRGGIELRTGFNLISWQGLDDTLLSEAVRGLGSPFESIIVYDPRGTQRWTQYDTASLQQTGGRRRLQRGDALWVSVSRTAVWLQPTGLMPVIRFPGGGPPEVHERIRADVEAAITLFREQYGIEADATQFWIYAAVDQESLIQALERDVVRDDFPKLHHDGFDSVRGQWSRSAAWVGGGVLVVKQQQWREANYYREVGTEGHRVWEGHHSMVHEYVHVVQAQISSLYSVLGFEFHRSAGYYYAGSPDWLVEGTARIVEDVQNAADGHVNIEEAQDQALSNVIGRPALEHTTGDVIYPLGRAASHFARRLAGEGAWLEIFRQMTSVEFGPDNRWISTPSWEGAFEGVVGLPMAEFYSDFESWRAANVRDGHQITGRIEWVPAGSGAEVTSTGIENVRMELYGPVQGTSPTVWPDREGRFAFHGLQDGEYSFSLDLGRGCLLLYPQVVTPSEFTFPIAGRDRTGIRIRISDDTCAWQIRGVLLDAEGSAIADVRITARTEGSYASASTSADGSFSITLPSAGLYRLEVSLDGCAVYYERGGATGSWNQATVVRVSDSDVTGIRVQLREGMCELRISGLLLNADGSPKSGVWVSASGVAGNGGAQSVTDGAFSFAVPGRGSYRLSVWIDNCSIYRRGDSSTTDRNSATEISITNADVTGVDFRLPQNPGSLCN